ncbi:hypothetical protein AVDCRST_MAG82-2133 [uncultured Rubrobacteraceae bacterium]|uniref:Uncharacterized protein n=1 Tax=uncultured Rubrobacteraceae bacterium TaxID=349277 RepID=A0A6J4Q5L8_9ACTN|nr:hypothetical protein AVDCRST_MAG82-2133 [uncultured Rubrobacteraceae bacterium]
MSVLLAADAASRLLGGAPVAPPRGPAAPKNADEHAGAPAGNLGPILDWCRGTRVSQTCR